MEEFNSNQTQVPPQVIEKPMAVTVFGVLNIAFGCLLLLCSPLNIVSILMNKDTETATVYKVWSLLSYIISTGLAAWLIAIGIGLLKMIKWARKGTIIFACFEIVFIVIVFGSRFLALYIGWVKPVKGILPDIIFGLCAVAVWLIYPILLLIFMQTAKVKKAFGE